MSKDFDKIMADYFLDKKTPSKETKDQIHHKLTLIIDSKKKKSFWIITFGIISYTILIFLIFNIFVSSYFAILSSLLNMIFSIFASVLITVLSHKERVKGGDKNDILG